MKVGFNLLLWTAAVQKEHFAHLDSLKAWGFDGAEFPMFDPECSPWEEIAAHCDDLGLGRTACTIMTPERNPVSEDASVRQAGLDHLKQCIDSCHTMGATVLAGPLNAPCGGLVGRGSTQEEFARCVEIMKGAASHAQDAGVALGLEPLNRFETYMLNCVADAVRVAEAVDTPGFGLLYDTFHAHIEEKSSGDAIRCGGKHIQHVHISENDRSTPGKGQVRWDENFAALREIGYDKWVTIEAFGKALPEVAAATCIWRSMFQTEEQLARDGLRFIRESWAA